MSTQNNGGPAFPVPNEWEKHWEGMTLRDYFAAKVMAAMIANSTAKLGNGCDDTNRAYANVAYVVADAMLAERAK